MIFVDRFMERLHNWRMNGIKHIRKQLGMTQTEIADAIGSEQSSICHYERGIFVLKPDLARKVAELAKSRGFACTLDDVYSEAPVLRQARPVRKAKVEVA